jgi:hypothetical protein
VTCTKWFVAREKVKLGPYSSAQLKELAQTAQLFPEDMVLREGERKWVAASAIEGLFVMASKPTSSAAVAATKPKPRAPEPEPDNVFGNLTAAPPGSRKQEPRRPALPPGDDFADLGPSTPRRTKPRGGRPRWPLIVGIGAGGLLLLACCIGVPAFIFMRLKPGVEVAEEYTIKLKSYPDKGKSFVIRETEKKVGTVKFFDATGKPEDETKIDETNEAECRRTTVEEASGKPRKYKETFLKAVTTRAGNTNPTAYQGRTVLFELKNGKYEVTSLKPPALSPRDRAALAERAQEDKLDTGIVPGKTVKVGDTWPLSGEAFAAFGPESEFDYAKSKGEAKLASAYEKEGHQWGVIELTIQLVIKDPKGGESLGSFELNGSIETAIDGSSTARKLNFSGPLKTRGKMRPGDKSTMVMEVTFSTTEERDAESEPPPDPEEPVGDAWKRFTDKVAGFSANFPGRVKQVTKRSPKGIPTFITMSDDGGEITYAVAWNELPKGADGARSKEYLKGAVKSLGEAVKSKREIMTRGHPGFQLILEFEEDGRELEMTSRVYVVNQRLFQVYASCPRGKGDPELFAKFLDSFKFPGES